MAEIGATVLAVAETVTSVPTVELFVGLQIWTDGTVVPAGHWANVVAERQTRTSVTNSKVQQ
jgi:hypothetical protein